MEAGGESIPRLYTRTGDRGTTALAGGTRVEKDSPRIRAYGAYDEVGAQLALAEATLPVELADIRGLLRRLAHELFLAQTELAAESGRATRGPHIERRHVVRLEEDIDRFDAAHPPLKSFVLPGGSRAAAHLHVGRTVARRAERELWTLNRSEPQRAELLEWANRLSDLLFAVALAANHALHVPETAPDYTV
ncbi:MAG TPA: cob(I)yrinic acid a,c-diamide adenosyltransferase [Thermoplasmata archaeon]|nr:cob(I)yrinic acid a,c-diamide adenosyltransferase [Thermoplasmata archaeon]